MVWKRKLPVPTSKYPKNVTRNILSCPFFKQLLMPLIARYMNRRFVRVFMISAE